MVAMIDLDDLLLPEGTRLLHIGPPKTGTTALQAAMYGARASMAAQGVYYASQHGRHAMSAVQAAIGLPSPWSAERKPPPRWKWLRLLAAVRRSRARRLVLSSEFFADATPEAAARVLDELDRRRVHVVVTLRPLARIIPSQWQQWVQSLTTTPFEEWVDGILNRPADGSGPLFWRRHRYDELIARWAAVVGPDRLTAVVLDERDRDMSLRVFERLTGLRPGTLAPVSDVSNRSMTLPEIEVIRAFNELYKAEKLPKPLYHRIMRFGAARYLEARTPPPDEPRIELPAWSRERVAAIAREMAAEIRASGVRVIGDVDSIAALPDPATPTPATDGPVRVSREIAAAAAMGILVASGLTRGSGRTTRSEDELSGDREQPPRAPTPVVEPFELLRMSTLQLVVVTIRRIRAAVVDRIAAPFRRRR